jgi:8-hydroxy-5-deazaflavin:NADPH oxidoreductase
MHHIGIVGAGHVGSSLAKKLVALGHKVSIANSRGPESLRQVERQTGAKAANVDAAVANADIVIVAIPAGLIPRLRDVLERSLRRDAIVIDTGNYYPHRDGRLGELDAGVLESIWVSHHLGRPVVKAFNNIIADRLAFDGKPRGAPDRIALPVAGGDSREKSVVMALVEELGFDAFDAGALDESWRQQPGQPAYCTNPTRQELPLLLARADSEKARINRDKGQKLMGKLPPDFPSRQLVRVARLSAGLDTWKPASWLAMLHLGMAVLRPAGVPIRK